MRTRANKFKLRWETFLLYVREKLFYGQNNHLNHFPRGVLESPSLELVKTRLGKLLDNLI